MSLPIVVLLEGSQTHLLTPQGTARTIPFSDDLAGWSNAVRDAALGAADSATDRAPVILIVGGAWLEVARPSLPPLAPADRRRALHHQADRFFAIGEPIASTIFDDVAVACATRWLRDVCGALESWARIAATLALPAAASLLPVNGVVRADASSGTADGVTSAQTMLLTLRGGAVRDVRIGRGAMGSESGQTTLDVHVLLSRVQRFGQEWPAQRQLLDVDGEAAVARAVARRWWRAGVLFAASLVFAAWALGSWRERTLIAAQEALRDATASASSALAARDRLLRADREASLMARPAEGSAPREMASQVLVRLGAILPTSAFVQRLEWDGEQWRIDGSAADAAALVPRLDGDGHFEGVRSLAPSTRFLDNGTPRSSFSIGFTVRRDSTAGRVVTAGGDTHDPR